MELSHRFSVPASKQVAWAAFNDVASVAECFPGAAVTDVDGDDFTGTCKVKLGPIALTYTGSGTFLEKDEAAGRFVLETKGKDKRGNGTASATVTATLTEAGPDRTDVEVLTDLTVTGKPAQFGRGVMQDVSDKLLGQFMTCLERRLGSGADQPATETAPTAPTDPGGAAGGDRYAETADEPDEALDLGATVLPILLRTYWRPLLGAVLVLLVLRRLLRGHR